MALSALSLRVQTRIPPQRLVELTNAEDRNAGTLDETILNAASEDVEGDFLTYVGVAYDDTNKAHIRAAVEGVVLRLRQYLGNKDLDDDVRSYSMRLADLAKGQGGRQRVRPNAPDSESTQEEDLREDLQDFIAEDLTVDPDLVG